MNLEEIREYIKNCYDQQDLLVHKITKNQLILDALLVRYKQLLKKDLENDYNVVNRQEDPTAAAA